MNDVIAYRPAWWLPGPHMRTIWAKFFRRRPSLPLRRERWDTPDGDFVDLHRLDSRAGHPRLLMLHGLEGSLRSHYALGTLQEAWRRGWAADFLVFRSCGDEPNHQPRFYHSGDTFDLDFVVGRLIQAEPDRRIVIAGVSLGGNVLLKWLGELGDGVPRQVKAAAAVSVPFDLARGSRHIGQGFARVYERHFLRSLRRKAHEKRTRYPELLDADAIDGARSMYEWDNKITAPVHGFRDAIDYYTRSSSLGFLARIRLPTLLLSAVDDPFLPSAVLDDVRAIAQKNPALHTEFVAKGGHVGFVTGRAPWSALYYAEWRVVSWLEERLAMNDES